MTPPEVITECHSAATMQALCGQWRKSKKRLGKHESYSALFKIGSMLHKVIKMQVKVSKNFPTRATSEP